MTVLWVPEKKRVLRPRTRDFLRKLIHDERGLLFPPASSYHAWSVDNWGTNPSATPGTSVTPGASNAQGSWTQLLTALANEATGFYVQVHSGATSGAAKNQLLDIGIDPAGGTSYTAVIQNFVIGASPALTVAGAREFFFPLRIPAGATVAARIRGSSGTAGTVRVAIRMYGQPSAKWALPMGSYTQTMGTIDTATSLGQSITPGNAADGSWIDLGATTLPLWWWQLGYQINNATITAEYTYFEVAAGDASNKMTLLKVMHGGTTGETAGLALQTQLCWHAAYKPVPAGANIYVRARCNNAPDTGYNVCVVGVG